MVSSNFDSRPFKSALSLAVDDGERSLFGERLEILLKLEERNVLSVEIFRLMPNGERKDSCVFEQLPADISDALNSASLNPYAAETVVEILEQGLRREENRLSLPLYRAGKRLAQHTSDGGLNTYQIFPSHIENFSEFISFRFGAQLQLSQFRVMPDGAEKPVGQLNAQFFSPPANTLNPVAWVRVSDVDGRGWQGELEASPAKTLDETFSDLISRFRSAGSSGTINALEAAKLLEHAEVFETCESNELRAEMRAAASYFTVQITGKAGQEIVYFIPKDEHYLLEQTMICGSMKSLVAGIDTESSEWGFKLDQLQRGVLDSFHSLIGDKTRGGKGRVFIVEQPHRHSLKSLLCGDVKAATRSPFIWSGISDSAAVDPELNLLRGFETFSIFIPQRGLEQACHLDIGLRSDDLKGYFHVYNALGTERTFYFDATKGSKLEWQQRYRWLKQSISKFVDHPTEFLPELAGEVESNAGTFLVLNSIEQAEAYSKVAHFCQLVAEKDGIEPQDLFISADDITPSSAYADAFKVNLIDSDLKIEAEVDRNGVQEFRIRLPLWNLFGLSSGRAEYRILIDQHLRENMDQLIGYLLTDADSIHSAVRLERTDFYRFLRGNGAISQSASI